MSNVLEGEWRLTFFNQILQRENVTLECSLSSSVMLVRYFGQKMNEVWTIKTLSGCLLTASETVVKS